MDPEYWPGHSHTRGPCSLGFTVQTVQPRKAAQWGGRRCDDPRRSLAALGGEMADARQTLQPARTSTCPPERGWPGRAAGSRPRDVSGFSSSCRLRHSHRGPRGPEEVASTLARCALVFNASLHFQARGCCVFVCLATEGSLAGQGAPSLPGPPPRSHTQPNAAWQEQGGD